MVSVTRSTVQFCKLDVENMVRYSQRVVAFQSSSLDQQHQSPLHAPYLLVKDRLLSAKATRVSHGSICSSEPKHHWFQQTSTSSVTFRILVRGSSTSLMTKLECLHVENSNFAVFVPVGCLRFESMMLSVSGFTKLMQEKRFLNCCGTGQHRCIVIKHESNNHYAGNTLRAQGHEFLPRVFLPMRGS